MAQHAKFSPSAAHRWMACPGSVKLSEQAPKQPPSPYAAEGTRAHEVAEAILLGKPIPAFADTDMIDNGKIYKSVIYEALEFYAGKAFNTESRLSVNSNNFGTCDCWFYSEKQNHLVIIDYKYGKGIKVDAQYNEQLMNYAEAAIKTHKLEPYRITLIIVQPRIENISQWTYSLNVHSDFRDNLESAIENGLSDDPKIEAGAHCRWCPAEAICPAKRQELQNLFGVNLDKPVKSMTQPDKLTGKQIADYIGNAEYLSSWLSALKQQAMFMIDKGEEVPGYTVEKTQGNRAWVDVSAVVNEFKGKFGANIYEEPKLKSPAQLEKVVGKKPIESLVHRPDGQPKLIKMENARSDKFIPFNQVETNLFSNFEDEV